MRKLLTFVFIAVSSQAATVIDFSFSGVKETTQMTVNGQGELSFADGLMSVGLSDLQSFSYDSTESYHGYDSVLPTVTLADLTSFNITMGQDGQPSTAELTTDYNDVIVNGDFQVGGFFNGGSGSGKFYAYQDGATGDIQFTVAPGGHDVSASVAPEPLSLALCGLGLVGCWALRRKRA